MSQSSTTVIRWDVGELIEFIDSLLSGRRKEASRALLQGLQIDPQDERLHELHESLGLRRQPVLGFLGRSNPLNHLLGRLRNTMLGSSLSF